MFNKKNTEISAIGANDGARTHEPLPYQVLNFTKTRLELKAQETLIFPVFFVTLKTFNCCQFLKI